MPQNPSRLSSKRLRCSANRVRAWSGGQVVRSPLQAGQSWSRRPVPALRKIHVLVQVVAKASASDRQEVGTLLSGGECHQFCTTGGNVQNPPNALRKIHIPFQVVSKASGFGRREVDTPPLWRGISPILHHRQQEMCKIRQMGNLLDSVSAQ